MDLIGFVWIYGVPSLSYRTTPSVDSWNELGTCENS